MAKVENPLLPHVRIREIFCAMLDARAGIEYVDGTAVPGSLAVDCAIAISIGLRDVKECNICAPDLALHPCVSLALGRSRGQVIQGECAPELQERLRAGALEQLYLAMGAAVASGITVLMLVGVDHLTLPQWNRLLADNAKLNSPSVIAALPGQRTGLSGLADRLGMPGIPVDAGDAVALYRVAGESFGRAAAGGGPVLIEALSLPDSRNALALLRRQMIARGAATERWAVAREHESGTIPNRIALHTRHEKVH